MAQANMVQLTGTLTGANSTSAYDWGGGPGIVVFNMATPGGSTAKLQISHNGGTTWTDLNGITTTASKAFWLDPLPICTIRATTTGGSGADITVFVQSTWKT